MRKAFLAALVVIALAAHHEILLFCTTHGLLEDSTAESIAEIFGDKHQ